MPLEMTIIIQFYCITSDTHNVRRNIAMATCRVCNNEVILGLRWCPICHSNLLNPKIGRLVSPFMRLAAYAFDCFGTFIVLIISFIAAVNNYVLISVVLLLVFILYFIWFFGLLSSGRTPGKLVFRMRVINEDGGIAGFNVMLLREFVCKAVSGFLFGLGFLWIIFDRDSQGWHDKMIRTYVIECVDGETANYSAKFFNIFRSAFYNVFVDKINSYKYRFNEVYSNKQDGERYRSEKTGFDDSYINGSSSEKHDYELSLYSIFCFLLNIVLRFVGFLVAVFISSMAYLNFSDGVNNASGVMLIFSLVFGYFAYIIFRAIFPLFFESTVDKAIYATREKARSVIVQLQKEKQEKFESSEKRFAKGLYLEWGYVLAVIVLFIFVINFLPKEKLESDLIVDTENKILYSPLLSPVEKNALIGSSISEIKDDHEISAARNYATEDLKQKIPQLESKYLTDTPLLENKKSGEFPLQPGFIGDKVYSNGRFGFSITYPADVLFPQPEPMNGDGQSFLNKTGTVKLVVSGLNGYENDSIENIYDYELYSSQEGNPKDVIVYKRQKNNWFVISGYRDGYIFYLKKYLVDDHLVTFDLSFPESEKEKWEPVLMKLLDKFKPAIVISDSNN